MFNMKTNLILLVMITLTLLVGSSCGSKKEGSTSKEVITLTTDNFNEEISTGVVMVDFWATWCMPCRAMGPVIDEIANQTRGKIKVGKVDVDAQGELANRFNVQGIPNIIIFEDGKPVENLVGLQSKETLMQALEKHVKLQE
jgi:thioredoxin 1